MLCGRWEGGEVKRGKVMSRCVAALYKSGETFQKWKWEIVRSVRPAASASCSSLLAALSASVCRHAPRSFALRSYPLDHRRPPLVVAAVDILYRKKPRSTMYYYAVQGRGSLERLRHNTDAVLSPSFCSAPRPFYPLPRLPCRNGTHMDVSAAPCSQFKSVPSMDVLFCVCTVMLLPRRTPRYWPMDSLFHAIYGHLIPLSV